MTMSHHPMANASDAQINEARQQAERGPAKLTWAMMGVAVGAFALYAGLKGSASASVDQAFLMLGFLNLVGVLFALVMIGTVRPGTEFVAIDTDQEASDEVSRLLATSPAARALRDEIVQAGRKLYVFDTRVMFTRARQEQLGQAV